MSDQAPICVRHLVAGYDTAPVVRDLSIEVREGEIVGLFGANGSGKTTTLLTISGLLPRMAGDVEVFGAPVRPRKSHQLAQRGLALVPEGRGIFHQLSVAENLRIHRHRRSTAGAEAILEVFPQLRGLMRRRAGLLSGGEQQMLAMSCALIGDPTILLIDELSLGLAPLIVQRLLRIVEQIARERNIGVLLVEQHVQAALGIADRAYVMANGQLTFSGAADELRGNRALLQESYLGGRSNGENSH
jgi:branched-chain amino acid transport system ATP-binding protein